MIDVVIWSPHYWSTAGHKRIVTLLIQQLSGEAGVNSVLLNTTHDPNLVPRHATPSNFRALILDWPWSFYLKRKPPVGYDAVLALSMCPTEAEYRQERACIEAGYVQYVLCAEHTPHSATAIATDIAPIARTSLLIDPLTDRETAVWNEAVRANARQPVPPSSAVLVMQSGNHNEAELHSYFAARDYPERLLLNSRQLPHQDPIRFALVAWRTVATPGYSTYWELVGGLPINTLTRRVRWHTFVRPVELLEARIQWLTDPASPMYDRLSLPTFAQTMVALCMEHPATTLSYEENANHDDNRDVQSMVQHAESKPDM